MKLALLLAALCLAFLTPAAAQTTYRNPVIPGFYPDPSVCRVGPDFYLVTSSFEYFPGVPIFHSTDLVNWRQIGHALTRPSQLKLTGAPASGGIYAPTIRHHNGTFYLITTNVSGGGNFLVTTQDPAGEWSEPVSIATGAETVIDPSLFFDDDGKVYLTTNGTAKRPGIRLCQLDVATGKLLTEPTAVWAGTGGRFLEAPHLYKKDGWYYLLAAEGGTQYGHQVTIARSKTIGGPYTANPANPILTHIGENAARNPIQGVGHADFVQAPDRSWWAVALGFRPTTEGKLHILGRETYLAPMNWPANEWPVINGNSPLTLDMLAPTLPLRSWPAAPVRDDFSASTLALPWNYLRNPVPTDYSLTDQPGHLRLRGSAATLNDLASPTFLGRRQQHFGFVATTTVAFTPKLPTEEAGLTVLMNNTHHYDLSIRRVGAQRRLVLTYHLGRITHVEKEVPLADGPIQLRVTGEPASYTFAFAQGAQPFTDLGQVNTRYLSSETAGGFTGVYLGLFATGNGRAATSDAYFDSFTYAP